MFNFFSTKNISEKEEKKEEWLFPREMWDKMYDSLLDIHKIMFYRKYQSSYFLVHNDFRSWVNRPESIDEDHYYREISHLLILLGDCTITEESTEVTYTWRDNGELVSIKDRTKNVEFSEQDNGDLLITFIKTWKKKNIDYYETYNIRVDAGLWKKKVKTQKYKIDCSIDEKHREDKSTVKNMISFYEANKKCSNEDFEGCTDKLLKKIKE